MGARELLAAFGGGPAGLGDGEALGGPAAGPGGVPVAGPAGGPMGGAGSGPAGGAPGGTASGGGGGPTPGGKAGGGNCGPPGGGLCGPMQISVHPGCRVCAGAGVLGAIHGNIGG